MSQDGSITKWIGELKSGGNEAAQQIWQRYCQRLIELARQNLRSSSRRVADEDEAAICAFDSFCRRAGDGRFPNLQDCDDLWYLLVRITRRKALNQATFLQRQKRDGGNVRGDSALEGYTHAEVGEKLNCSARTVARKLLLIRAKLQLQECE